MMNGNQPMGSPDPQTQQMQQMQPEQSMQMGPQIAQNIMPENEIDPTDMEDNQARIPNVLKKYIQSKNIAEDLDDHLLEEMGRVVCHNTIIDDQSRDEWRDQMEKALEIAKQVYKEKSYPWPHAANVKYPLILTACMQFNARTFPIIEQDNRVVYVDVMNPNPPAQLKESAERIGNHMSYQLLGVNKRWLDDKDKLLMILPLMGIVFTKTSFNEIDKLPQIDLCLPDDIIVNQKTKSLEEAQRITHALYFNNNDLVSRMRSGLYLDIPLEELMGETVDDKRDDSNDEFDISREESVTELRIDESKIHLIYEQHCYYDLDDDGYAEPYVVTVHAASQKVLRIVARYNYSSFVFDDTRKKEFIKINPIQYFTVYRLMHSPDGDFYGMGFGQILYPLNQSVNTILNQLLDAGTLSNQQSGFIGKGLRLRKRKIKLKPGEWELIDNAHGVDISSNIVPIPTKDPSMVLYQLLGMLVEAAQGVANVSDVMQGQMPPPNTPATTVVSLIEQGTKVFSGTLRRLYHALENEYNKLYQLNRKYLTEETTYRSSIISGFISPQDYTQNDFGIFPVADPQESIEAQSLARAQALMQLMGNPDVNPREILTRYLEALKISDIDKILAPPPDPNAPPPPEEQKTMAEASLTHAREAEIYASIDEKMIRLDLEEKRLLLEAEETAADAAAKKVASVSEITQLEQTADQQQIDAATQLVEAQSQDLSPVIEAVQSRIDVLEKQAGLPVDNQGQQRQQMPQDQESPDMPGNISGEGSGGLGEGLENQSEGEAPGAISAPQQPEPSPE